MRMSILSLNRFGKILFVSVVLIMLTGCAATQKKIDPAEPILPAQKQFKDMKSNVKYPIADAYDPWEPFNRTMYVFNYNFDKYVYLPIVSAYEFIMPDFLENRVSDFFRNIGELKNLTNGILQLKADTAGITIGRIVMNTTIGLGGLFDVATPMGILRQNEDLGQTFGFYGMGPGPYLVLPILGPSSLRDTVGLIGDAATRTAVYESIDPLEHASEKEWIEAGIYTLEAIDKRHLESFRYYETGSPFEYELIRFLYLTKRKWDIGDSSEQADE